MIRRLRATDVLLVFSLVACRENPRSAPARHSSTSAGLDSLDEMRLAALPEIVRLSEESMKGLRGAAAYCLSTSPGTSASPGGASPSIALLSEVASHRPPIFSVADCTGEPSELAAPGVRGRAWSMWVIVSSVRPQSAAIIGGYNAGPLTAAEWSCVMHKDRGKWMFSAPCKLRWVS
jgi:hypothetical protein